MAAMETPVTREEENREFHLGSILVARCLRRCGSNGQKLQTLSTLWEKGEESSHGPMMVTTPPQLVHLDFTSFKTTTNLNESPKIENVLVIIGHFTRYTRAYVTKDQKVLTAAKSCKKDSDQSLGHPKGSSQIKAKPSLVKW